MDTATSFRKEMMFAHDSRSVKRCGECGEALTMLDEERGWTLCLTGCGASCADPRRFTTTQLARRSNEDASPHASEATCEHPWPGAFKSLRAQRLAAIVRAVHGRILSRSWTSSTDRGRDDRGEENGTEDHMVNERTA